jgi:GNAT superfamily N-acetyltransferase
MSGGIEIRRVTIDRIRPLRHEILRPGRPFDTTLWDHDHDPDTLHLAAFQDDAITGIATLFPEAPPGEPCENTWRLRGMAVRETRQRGGIGRALCDAAAIAAREKGGQILWCNARSHARAFYERCGFTSHGPEFHIEGIGPHFQMRKNLRG